MNVETGFRGYTSEALRAALVQVIHDTTYGAGYLAPRCCSLIARGMVEAMMRGDVETCKIVEGTLLSKLGPEAVAAASAIDDKVRELLARAQGVQLNDFTDFLDKYIYGTGVDPDFEVKPPKPAAPSDLPTDPELRALVLQIRELAKE